MPELADTKTPIDEVEVQETALLASLQSLGGHAGNTALRRQLQWTSELYWTIRNRLVDSGRLTLGQGKGGSVNLVVDATPDEVGSGSGEGTTEAAGAPTKVTEVELYPVVAEVLRLEWSKDMRFRNTIVAVTAKQGKKDTGGTWTRPDIVMAALRVFPHVPGKYFDLITFELKALNGIDVTAVFEALSHRRAATQAYVWLHLPEQHEEPEKVQAVLERIESECTRFGIGMIVATDPSDYDSWDVRVVAARQEPDPAALNEFIAQQLSPVDRDELAQWFR